MNDFVPFPKIPRWHKDVIVTEKIDGTNACIVIPEDGSPVVCQSRKRVITPGDDNYGFASWVHDNLPTIVHTLGPGRHFGEWWGVGIQRGYGLRERRFTPFARRGAVGEPAVEIGQGTGIWTLPVVAILSHPTAAVAEAHSRLALEGSLAVPGYRRPEGFVVYHSAAGQMFKVILNDDGTVNEIPKGVAA